jgi:fatty acid desaturase
MLAAVVYAELRRAVIEAGLLDRAPRYYALRSGASFLLLGSAIGVAMAVPSWALLAAVAIAFGSVQVALIGHDAGHLAVFKDTGRNWALGTICWSLVLGISFWYWNDRHNRHHACTNDLGADPDVQWAGLVAYSLEAARSTSPRARWLARYQALLGPAYTLALPLAFRVEGWRFTVHQLNGRRQHVEGLLLGLSAVLWLLPSVWLGPGWLATYVLAQALAGLYLALAIAPNHKGMPMWPAGTPLSFLERQVLSSRNITPHPITDFVLGGLNYQIEHHLFPTMPRVNFGRARRIVRPFLLKNGLPYEEMSAVASYRLVLAELQRVGQLAAAESQGA